MKKNFSSRERMLSALENKKADYTPCSFMIFTALQKTCRDQFEFIEKQAELGLDVKVELPELPFRFHPEVKVKEWKEVKEGRALLHKEYITSQGTLTAIVKKTEDWPYEDNVPLFNDYLAPRSEKFLVEEKEDLKSLKFLFGKPTPEDIANFRNKSKRLKKLAGKKGLLVSGGWQSTCPEKGIDREGGTMGADALMWLCGAEKSLILALDNPEVIAELLQMISAWNMERMEVYLAEEIDLLTRRAWYEGTELWSPALYHRFMFPILEKEIKLTHQAGAKFGYIMTSGVMPLLDDFLTLGFDALIGVDPIQGKGTEIAKLKERLNRRICLWGGVNGFLTVERGDREKVREAVEKAMAILGPEGFILSPVDNVTDNSENTWNNVKTLIKVWQKLR
ncbi:MAG: uroporphyrinogen decarboxylase family protein [Candidatus Omnitrophota bacterium]